MPEPVKLHIHPGTRRLTTRYMTGTCHLADLKAETCPSSCLKMNGCKNELIADFQDDRTRTTNPVSVCPEFHFFVMDGAVSSSGPALQK